jgi:quinol-cytochrome oxidoreductase complex cytochrome b subunit/cytochrome c551/c552
MKSIAQRLIDWIEYRTGLETAIKNFLFEDIPASSGWHQVFGSVAVFLFLVQALSGLLLAFNYAPTPGDAYNSVKYIITALTGGALIRGLHHWGASMMIVVVVLHMIQVFIYGAYKRPREATWIVGVILFLITLGFGLTGYLLPWDNRAYWGTIVATQLVSKTPLIGPYLTRLLGGEGSIGVVTFARFFALHVLLLPPLATSLIALHVFLVRKHGVAPMPNDHGATKKFFPEQVFKDTVAIFVAFVILFVMAVVAKVPLDRLADPTDSSYIPRPDWYFLFLFQILKLFGGSLELVGSVVLPALAVAALVLVPFLDRGEIKRLAQRTVAIGVVVFGLLGWTGLTLTAVITTPKSSAPSMEEEEEVQEWQQLTPEELAGIGYFRREQCSSCHNLANKAPKVGPNLAATAIRRTPAWMIDHFKNPSMLVPGTSMPPIDLDDEQLAALASFLLKLSPSNAQVLNSAPTFPVEGAMVYKANQCGTCHMANGEGMKIGPELNGLFLRRTKEWVEEHLRNPQTHTPDSPMPSYKLSPTNMDRLLTYLFSIPRIKPFSMVQLRKAAPSLR